LLIWTRTQLQVKGELSHFPSSILEWFSKGDSSEIVARAKIHASKLPFHLLSTTPLSSRWIQVYYSWSFKLLDARCHLWVFKQVVSTTRSL
jgi:hypothetical protein